MGITDHYLSAFRKLFPQGEYWDRQFADPESDVSLFCRAKLPECIRFRGRMDRLRDESNPAKTEELIDEWERALLGAVSTGLDINQRRALLMLRKSESLNRSHLRKIAEMYGFNITGIQFPYTPAFFGFSRFGLDRAASPASWQSVHIHVTTGGNGESIPAFETQIKKVLLANYAPCFIYNGGE